jgi:apolipoprotein N-acyltransferase
MPGFDLKQINRNDQLIIAGGGLGFIFSFLPWYKASAGPYSATWNAWQGFFGTVGVLFLLAAAAIVALRVFANFQLPKLPVGPNLLVLALAGIGTVFTLFEWLLFDPTHGAGRGISQGLGWAGYIFEILVIAETVGAYLNFKASGEKMAWDQTAMPARPAAGTTAAAPTYPAEGVAPTYPPVTPPVAEYPTSDPGTSAV